jgi:hypothetical protein
MIKRLFIDDERFPPNVEGGWVTARSSYEARKVVEQCGIPKFISFDHDLGGNDTAIPFVNWLCDSVVMGELELPEGFNYYVHSQNPIGKANIEGKMDFMLNWMKNIASKGNGA